MMPWSPGATDAAREALARHGWAPLHAARRGWQWLTRQAAHKRGGRSCHKVVLLAVLSLSPAISAAQTFSLETLVQPYTPLVLLVEARVAVPGGMTTSHATAVLVHEDLALTVAHAFGSSGTGTEIQLFRRRINEQRILVSEGPVRAQIELLDQAADVALLRLQHRFGTAREACPLRPLFDASQMKRGESLGGIGYHLNLGQHAWPGSISSETARDDRWHLQMGAYPGSSGAPAFERGGALVGLVFEGITSWQPLPLPDPQAPMPRARPVTGIVVLNTFERLRRSPVIAAIPTRQADPDSCWEPIQTRPVAPPSSISIRPAVTSRAFRIGWTKDDHPNWLYDHKRDYEERFEADTGYRIVECRPHSESRNIASNEICNIERDGATAVFKVRLGSGPIWDRRRGWWGGVVTLRQERKD